jgi:predicted DNA repair protein MutK
MSVGLLALLDDVVALAKVAAASLDDVAGQAAKVGAKAAGVVIDDAAVTPRYVVGFAAERELPIIAAIALGSLRNKVLILMPVALALGALAPWAIVPLLMLGGAYLTYEGAEKVYEALFPHAAHAHEEQVKPAAVTAEDLERGKIAGAIKTDFILSAEIMAITLAALPDDGFWARALIMTVVAVGITIVVYGGVALIVKADDVGVALAANATPGTMGALARGVGRSLVAGMPVFLRVLAGIGTAAMIWVGGGILVHGLAVYGLAAIEHGIHDASEWAARALPGAAGVAAAIVTAAGAGIVGLLTGLLLIPIAGTVIAPAWKAIRRAGGFPA